jgi:hypothetical protein
MYFNTECPTRYQTRNFFNNSNTNEDIATKFEQHVTMSSHFLHIEVSVLQISLQYPH